MTQKDLKMMVPYAALKNTQSTDFVSMKLTSVFKVQTNVEGQEGAG